MMKKDGVTVESGGRIGARVRALTGKISTLSRLISLESKRPLPDQMKLSEYKKYKLKLKDEIRQILTTYVRQEQQTFYVPATLKGQRRV